MLDGSERRRLASFKVVEIPQLSQLAALEAGRIDGIALTNPAYTIAMSSGKVRSVANIHAAVAPRYLLAMWFSSTSWVERNRSAAERFARVIADAVGYVNGHNPKRSTMPSLQRAWTARSSCG